MTTAPTQMLDARLLEERRAARRIFVLALYALAAFSGAAQGVNSNQGLIYLLTALALATAATLWVVVDARMRDKPLLPIVRILVFFTWPVATLVNLVATRGWRGLGWWVLHALGLMTTFWFNFFLAYFLFFGMGMAVPAR